LIVCFIIASIVEGKLYSWGKGYIGHGKLSQESKPKRIAGKIINREFTSMFSNDQAIILFAPMRVYSVSPCCGPACGGTIISIIGTGLKETEAITVRFKSNDKQIEVKGKYIEQHYTEDNPTFESIFCTTPNFEETFKLFPQRMNVSISLDGMHYIDCDKDFLVYSTSVKINNAQPKCGSVLGGTELTLMVDINPLTSQYLFNLCFGFQARQGERRGVEEKKEEGDQGKKKKKVSAKMSHSGAHTSLGVQEPSANLINALNPREEELMLDNWYCSVAKYENVDVTITALEPTFGPAEGGTVLMIKGTGFYDSSGKKVKFESRSGEREMTTVWDRKEKAFTCKTPPAIWLLGDKEENKLKLSLTLNGQDWICAGTFEYYETIIERMSYDFELNEVSQEERMKRWSEEEPLLEEQELYEVKKAEEQAKITEDTQIFESTYKRTGTIFYIWGHHFKRSNVRINLNQ
jgi:hypothetical protein